MLAATFVSEYNSDPTEALVVDSAAPSLVWSVERAERESRLADAQQMNELLADPTRFVRTITIEHGCKVVPGAREFLAVLPTVAVECVNGGNSVAVWIEGEAFSGPAPSSLTRKERKIATSKERKIATKVLDVFRTLVARLQPSSI